MTTTYTYSAVAGNGSTGTNYTPNRPTNLRSSDDLLVFPDAVHFPTSGTINAAAVTFATTVTATLIGGVTFNIGRFTIAGLTGTSTDSIFFPGDPQNVRGSESYGVDLAGVVGPTTGILIGTFVTIGAGGSLDEGDILTTGTGASANGTYVPPVTAGYSSNAPMFGPGGGTPGGLAASKIRDTTYGTLTNANVLVAAGGTFDEAARNVDPGVTKVLAPASGGPTNYKIASSTLIGTATLPSAANVATGTGAFGVGGTGSTPSYPTTSTTIAANYERNRA